MVHMGHGLLRAMSPLLTVACLVASARAVEAADLSRDHWTLAVGSMAQPSEDLRLGDLGLDFRSALNVALSMRYTVNESFDITLEAQDDEADSSPAGFEDAEMALTSWFTGPGVRYYPTRSSLRPFVQASVYYVEETIQLDQFGDRQTKSRSGAGLGLAAGIELLASHRFSIPLTLQGLIAKPAENISGLGFNVGVTFNTRPRER